MNRILRIWRLLNLPCDRVAALVSRSLDQELPRMERAAVTTHLVYCRACRRFRNHLRLIQRSLEKYADDAGLAGAPTAEALSPDARERIARAIDAARGSS